MYKAIIDADYIKYTAAAAGEQRSIVVTHKDTLEQWNFKNRTEFWGTKKTKDGGELEKINTFRDSPYTWEEFVITDIQTADPIENVLHTAKLMYEGCYKALGTTKHKGYIGKGESFRVERSTILKYKQNRDTLVKPLYLGDVEEYLVSKLKCEPVTYYENDDVVVMESYADPSCVVVGVDKDYYGQDCKFLNMNRIDEGVVNGSQFGKLWLSEKGDVRGIGRMFLYYQILSNDTSDNYAANSASDIKWAGKSAYKVLKDCTNDKEAFQVLKDSYLFLYPEKKQIIGWRGEPIEIDWKYVLVENFDLARMVRFEGDIVDLDKVFMKAGIEWN